MLEIFQVSTILFAEIGFLILGVLICILIVVSLKGTRLNGNKNTTIKEDFSISYKKWQEQPIKSAISMLGLVVIATLIIYAAWH